MINSYVIEQYWSAIYYWGNLVYTNAHVILNNEDEPFGNYRLCKTTNFKEKPVCFSVWELLYYDETNDLAVLKISNPEVEWITESTKTSLEIWDVVKVYWYPSNWWDTISYTEWKVSWYEDWYYKVDANFDAWNSWGWVFDLDWNLVWMAVSVNVGYTTMWYIIPLEKINEFIKNKDAYSVKEYSEEIDEKFLPYSLLLQQVIWAWEYLNDEIELKNIKKYGFSVDYYSIDDDEKNYKLVLSDENNDVWIFVWNFSFTWKSYLNIDDYYNYLKEDFEENISEYDDYSVTKIRKLKLQNKETILQFLQTKTGEVYLSLIVWNSKNIYQNIIIYWDNIKNKSFLNWLKLILLNLKINSIDNDELNDDDMQMDNLFIWKQDNFFIKEYSAWDILVYFWDDIIVENSYTSTSKIKYYDDSSLSSLIRSNFNYLKDYYYYNFVWIKQTKSWDNYSYVFMKNNITKWWEEDLNEKKYYISAIFYDIIDDEKFYTNTLSFTFDNLESKEIIDDLLYSIKTNSWELPFEFGTLEVWENLIEEPEF